MFICDNRIQYKENGEINQSLFALKECIRSLIDGKSYVPYRRCELTKMLRQSFEPESKTYILSTISQEMYNSHTTLDVLNYITDMKKIQMRTTKTITKITKLAPIKENYMLGSPKYNHIKSNQNILQRLNNMENTILSKILHRKSSKDLFENYIDILEKNERFY